MEDKENKNLSKHIRGIIDAIGRLIDPSEAYALSPQKAYKQAKKIFDLSVKEFKQAGAYVPDREIDRLDYFLRKVTEADPIGVDYVKRIVPYTPRGAAEEAASFLPIDRTVVLNVKDPARFSYEVAESRAKKELPTWLGKFVSNTLHEFLHGGQTFKFDKTARSLGHPIYRKMLEDTSGRYDALLNFLLPHQESMAEMQMKTILKNLGYHDVINAETAIANAIKRGLESGAVRPQKTGGYIFSNRLSEWLESMKPYVRYKGLYEDIPLKEAYDNWQDIVQIAIRLLGR